MSDHSDSSDDELGSFINNSSSARPQATESNKATHENTKCKTSTIRKVLSICIVGFPVFYLAGIGLGTLTASRLRNKTAQLGRFHSVRSNSSSSSTPTSWHHQVEENGDIGYYDLYSSISNTSRFHNNDPSIPECARDVYVSLQTATDEGRNDHKLTNCKGLLLRDDIIVTSKECSKHEFTFHFAGFGTVRAVPHSSLNSQKEMPDDSPLGFLEASPPWHYIFVDHPIRRTRMFLSQKSAAVHPRFKDEDVQNIFILCGNQNQPIAYNFPVNREMIPLGTLFGLVPEDILWEELDINTATALSYKEHIWWTKPTTLRREEMLFQKLFGNYRGPPGSLSLGDAMDDFSQRVGAICEAVDPRGHRYRRQFCFEHYFLRYQNEKPFSGQHFFDWLDFGHGKRLLEENHNNDHFRYMKGDEKCHKKDFNNPRYMVTYFTQEEQPKHEIYFEPSKDGTQLIGRYRHNNEFVAKSSEDLDDLDPHVYMWDLNKTFYLVEDPFNREKYGTDEIKHSSILAGGPTLSAGKADFGENGVLRSINFSSGHYYPDIHSVSMMYRWVQDQGWNTTAFQWLGRGEWFKYKGGGSDLSIQTRIEECNKYDWESVDIVGFCPAQLNQACGDVTTSSTWDFVDDD